MHHTASRHAFFVTSAAGRLAISVMTETERFVSVAWRDGVGAEEWDVIDALGQAGDPACALFATACELLTVRDASEMPLAPVPPAPPGAAAAVVRDALAVLHGAIARSPAPAAMIELAHSLSRLTDEAPQAAA